MDPEGLVEGEEWSPPGEECEREKMEYFTSNDAFW